MKTKQVQPKIESLWMLVHLGKFPRINPYYAAYTRRECKRVFIREFPEELDLASERDLEYGKTWTVKKVRIEVTE